MTMVETWLVAALALVHLCGTWLMFAMVEDHWGRWTVKRHQATWFTLCLLGWELIVLFTIYQKTDPKRLKP